MAFCTKCGGANEPNASFCRACGASLAIGGGSASMAAPPAPPAKKKSSVVLKIVVGLALALCALPVAFLVIIHLATRAKPAQHSEVAQATPQELADAQTLGLSKNFATQAWVTQRSLQFRYTGLLGAMTSKDYDASLDESLRASLPGLKTYISTDADRLAFQKMVALSWTTHAADGKFGPDRNNPLSKRLFDLGDDCLYAVGLSFEVWEKSLKANAAKQAARCLSAQKKAKEDLDRQGIANWDDIKISN